MKKVLLFITSTILAVNLYAQEGTKQFMPNNDVTERLWLEFRLGSQTNGTENCPENERINVYLRAGEKVYFGMRMADFAEGWYWDEYTYYINRFSFRLHKPGDDDNPEDFAISRTRIRKPGEAGFIDDYDEAVAGPIGAKLNGQPISGGYEPIIYIAEETGNYYFEFESWRGTIGVTQQNRRFALELFDVTVTDANNNIITNPGDPNRSAGRLWSKSWALTTASFTKYPINAHFFVVTSDEFINKVNFKQYPYSFKFVANHYGIKTESEDDHYVRRTQSQVNDQISGSIGEYPIFLNDPDRSVWPNTMLPPPTVEVWTEEGKFFDYQYNRNPMYVDTDFSNVVLTKNHPDCPHQDITFFKIDANIDGFTAILIDANNDGTFTTDGSDRVIYRELRKGLNYILWDFKTDDISGSGGADVPNGIYNASATLYGRGPSHFPMHDVEQLDGIVTSAIRPFNKLVNTIYWDDRNIQDPTGTPSSTWGDLTGGNLMFDTDTIQLKVGEQVPRKWSWSTQEDTYNNGNNNTMNTWFNAIDLGYADITLVVQESSDPARCINGTWPWVGDLWMEGPKNTDITFTLEDFESKFFQINNLSLQSIEIETLPQNGTLKYNNSPITAPYQISSSNIGNLKFTPASNWHGETNFEWKAYDGFNWSYNQEHVYIVINTPPTITEIADQTVCANSSTDPLAFTIDDAETPINELVVTGFSAFPEVVPHENIVITGTGATRNVTVTPAENQGGMAIVYIMVDDGFTQVLEEFAVTIMPSLEFTGDTAICYGNGLSLTAVEFGADMYSWKFGDDEKSPERTVTQASSAVDIGLWTLTITQTKDTKTCTSTREFTVRRSPDVTFEGEANVCVGEQISLAANEPNATYLWEKGGTFVSNQQNWVKTAAIGDSRTDYTLTVTKNTCTHTSDPFEVNVKPQPQIGLTVTGSNVDPGHEGTITVENSELDFTYIVYKGATYVTQADGNDGDLIIQIDPSFLEIGTNEFRIVSTNINCEYELTNKGVITVNQPGFTVTPLTLNTTEGGANRTFTVRLNTEPTNNVTVALTSGNTNEGTISPASLTFTDANWDTEQTVTVTPVRDWIVDGPKTYTIELAAATSDDIYYQGIDPEDVTVTNTDIDVAGVTVSKTTLTTTEVGGSDSFTLVLTSIPQSDVTITFSGVVASEGEITIPDPPSIIFNSTNWDSPQTVTITGVDEQIDDGDFTYTVNMSASSGDGIYDGISISSVSVTNQDNDAAGITFSPTSITTYEAGGSTQFTVKLNSQPTTPVTIEVVSSNTLEGTVTPGSLTFNSSDWNTGKNVTVYGANDFVVDGNQSYQINLTVTGGGSNYLGRTAFVSATNIDNDIAGIVSSTTTLTTAEPDVSTTFQVRLNSKPTTTVKIGVTSSDVTEGAVSPGELTFTTDNWDDDQTVTVTGVDDAIIDGNIPYTVTLEVTQGDAVYNAVSDVVVNATNTDNDVAGIELSKTTVTTNETGTTDQFSVRLTAQPNSNVVLNITGVDELEGSLDFSSLTFTTSNWNTFQPVTVTGVDDAIADGNQTYTLTVAYSSGDANFGSISETLSVTNIDNDAAGITVSPTTLSTTEGLTNTFTISINSQPTANVTINVVSGNTNEGTVSPASVLFTNSNWTAKTVTVTGVIDNIDDDNKVYTITTSNTISTDANYNNKPVDDVTVTNIDINTAGVSVDPTSGLTTTEAGGKANYNVRLNSKPTNQVEITSVSGTPTEGTVTTNATLIFNSSDWNTWKQVTVEGVNDNIDDDNQPYSVTLSASSSDGKYAGITIPSVSLTNTDDDVAEVLLSQTTGLVTTEAGGTATFTVSLKTQPKNSVTISLLSSNTSEGTVSPTTLNFNAGNYSAPQTVTLTGVEDQIDDGDQPYTISLTASSSDTKYNNISIPSVSATNTDDDTAGVILSAISNNTTEAGGTATFTVRLNSEPTEVVTIASASNRTSEGVVIGGNTINFDNTNWETNQTVTVRGVQDLIDDGDQTYSIVLSATSGDGIYNGIVISSVSVINEDDDEVGLVISEASLTTSEPNGTDDFTVKLNSQPTGNVTVAVSTTDATEGQVAPTNLSFTTSNWNTPQNVTVTGQDDDEVDGNIDYNISLKANSTVDTKYNNLAIVAVPATNDDDDVAEITVTPYAGLSTTEAGGTATFNIVLTSKPTSSVSVRLTSSNIAEGYVSAVSRGSLNIPGNEATVSFEPNEWNSQVTVTIKGVDDDIDDNNVAYTIVTETAVSSDGNYSIINPRDVSVINNDNDTYGTTVSPTTLSMDEDGTAQTATIVLRSRPTATVRFNITSSNTNRATVSPSYVEFLSTGDSWRTAQTLTVTPVDNFIADGNAEPNIVFAPGISTDNNYKNHVPSAIALTITDDDIADITVSSVTGFTTEAGGTATFTVVLTSEPTSMVTINMSSSDTSEGFIAAVTPGRGIVDIPGNTASITFDNTNWDEPVTITVEGENDDEEDGSQIYQVIFSPTVSDDISYDEINLDPVEIVNQDDDKAGYTVYPVSGLVTTESGTTAQFNVFLNTQPTGNVVVDLASTDISEGLITNVTRGTWDEGANTANITFDETHWDVTEEVTITVTGIDDLTDDGDIPYSITLTANAASTEDPLYNILIPSVSLTNRDDLTPRPAIDNETTDQETPIIIDVLANDLGLDYGETVTVVTQPEHGTAIANADNTITYTPDRYYHGSYNFTYRVCNTISNCANSTVNVDVTWIDVTPIANDDFRGASVNTTVGVDVLFNDENLYDIPIAVSTVGLPNPGGTLTVSNDSVYFTPEADYIGVATFTYRVTDNDGDTDDGTVTINVREENHIPAANNDVATVIKNTPKNINVLANDSGLDDGWGDLRIHEQPTNGLLTINADRTIDYEPNPDYVGSDSFIYLLEDVDGDYDLATVTITVIEEPNHVPVANPVSRATEMNVPVDIDVLSFTSGIEDGVDNIYLSPSPANGTATVEFDAGNSYYYVNYIPDTDWIGTEVFGYQVCDVDGDCSGTATITVFVKETGTNHNPIANEDEVDTYINNPVKIAVLNNDTGLDDGFGELTIHTGPSAGTVTVDEGNTITYTPSYMYFGTMTFEYRVADIDGDWDKATVTVNVLETPNFVPVANNDSCATSFNQPVTIDVLFNDENTFDEPLTLNITELPTEGTAIVNVNNTVTFTPAEDYVGTITFKYTITDKDTDVSNEATVSVKVKSGTNYVPEANDDEATTHVNTFVDIDVLSNDSGLDDGFGALTIHVTPQFGSVSVNDNRTIRFTPGNFFIGEETFVYVLTDKDGDYSTATVTVRVTEKPNSIPVANDISVGTSFNTPVDIDVLHNDTGLDDEPIVVTISQAPHPDSGVATVIPATNFVTFTPTDGFIGQTQFRYTVTDKDGDSDFATVTVNVKEGTNYVPTAVDDEVETIENIAVEIAVLDNDTGFEDGFGSLEVYQVPQFGLAQVNDRTISYTPANNFIGVVTFKYKVSDLDGDWGIANVTVTVTERPNYIPVANNDSCATSFNQATTIDVLFNDEELFDEPLLVNISQNPTEGTAVVNPDNTVTFTPAIDYVGKMTFTYTVTDKDGDISNPGIVSVNVKSGENFVPIANDDDTTTYINQAVTLNVLTNDSGLDDGFGALEISASPAFGNAVVNDNRTITFTPANNFVGEISFTYILTDLDGDYDIATVTVDVVEKPNSIPVANDITLATSFNTPVEIDVLHNDTGLDDIPITVSITQEPNPIHGAVVVNPANTVTFTPTDGYIGDASFIYTVTDVDGDADFAVVTVTVKEGTNYVPTAVDDNASTYVNTSIEVPVLANDTGFEDGFGRLELFEAPEFGSAIASTYTVLYTPANFFIGEETFRYKVSDSDGDYSIATVTVSVSEKPNLVPIAHNDSCATSFNEAVVVNVLINDENLGDEPITVAINGNPTQGTASVNADNTVTYTPATDFVGKMEFTYTVTDKDGDSDEATVSVNVKAGTNYVPVAYDDEDTTYVNTPVTINVLQNDTGLEDGFNEISIQVQPQFGTAVVNSNNTITYTPSNNMLGEETFTYKLVDNDGDFDLAEVNVTIIEKPNSRPVANDVSVATSFNTPVTIDVLHNDTGLEDTPITVSITQPVDTKKGTAVVNADNTVTFTPTTDYVGFATFTYTATDRDGDSDNAIVTVNVKSGINYWPVAEDDEATTYVNTLVDIAVLANDSGLEDGIGAITIQVAPQFGSVTISNNIVTYTPANFFEGEETFVYKLADTDGDFDFATVTVTTVERPNSIPIANNVSVATSFNTPVTIDVLHNDTGLDDTPITVTISLQADAEEGTATVNPDNTVTFTPTENYIGFATFEYTVTDADGEFDDAIVTVNVKEGINYVPVANDDEASTIVNRSVDIPVLRNDTGLEDGIDSLSIQVRPKFGTATVNQNLTVTYTPSNNYTGVETFIYKLTDNDGDFDFALVTVTITEQENSIPVANDDSRGTSFNTPVIINVLHNDTGLDDVPITVSIKSLPIYTQGTVEVNDDNTITFTPATDYTGTASFSYTVTDANEDSDDANVTVIVKSGTNYIPDASDDEAETIQNTSVEIAVLANDRGLEDGFGSITIFQQPPFGKVMVTPNRTLNYIPDNNYIGEESFVYQLSDVDGDYDLATVTVTVIERPNYIPVANDDRRGTSFNTPVTIDVLFNDEGIEDKPLTLTVSLAPDAAQGTAAVNSNNTITFTPIQGFVGEATFRYTVTDKDGENDDALVTVNVKEGVNYVPNAVNDQATTTINTSVDVAILANDSGFEDGFGEITIHNEPPFGTVEINENRTVTYTPSPNFVGVETFTYTVSDIDGDFDIATVTVTVTEKPNSVPVANDDRRGTSFNTAVDIDVLFNDLGLDDEPITVEVSTAPIADQGTAVVNENNTVTFTPKTGFIGFANFVYTITDADGERDDATVTVSVKEGENYVPNAVDDNATTIVNTPVDIAVVANDTGFEDGFGDLAIHIAPQFGTATIKDRSVTYTPSPNFIGEETFVYVVSDADGDYDIATVTVTVTDKPNYVPIANDDKRGTSFNTSVTVDVLFNDLNLEDEPITVTISENPTTETGAVIVNSKNMVVFTPTTGFVGTSTFRYTVTDNNGDSDDAQVTINVKSGENFVPEANDDEAYTYLNTPVRIVVLQNDGGLEDGVENIAIYSNPATGTVEVNSDFSVTYIPSNNYVGTEEFTYIVSDVDGDFDMATVTVSVTEDTNIIPVANDDNRGTSFNTAVTVDVLANDTGLSDLPIAVTISENPASEMGTTTVNADNTVTFTPATGYIGPAVFRYTVTDANFDNDNALVTINVKEGENAVPIANDDQRGTSLNTEIVVDVLANDEGLDDEPITLTITSEPDVEHGVAFVNSNNTITFTPIVGFIGIARFTYKVTDVDGDFDSALVMINVKSGNNIVPVAVNDEVTTTINNDVIISVLDNDTGLDDKPILVTISMEPKPEEGAALENTDNTITFSPAENYTGTLTFMYRVTDGDGDYSIATVTVNVVESGSPVTANDDNVEITKNSSVDIDILANDTGINGVELTVSIVTEPLFGVATVNYDYTLNYVPNAYYYGLDSLTYQLCDLDNNCDEAKVRITVIDSDPNKLQIPEGFSPNGDTKNDYFEIIGLEYFGQVSVKIYNRWGNLVYKSNFYRNDWDGTSNTSMSIGKTLPTGTYYYIIEIVETGEKFNGNVFLKR